jgi:RNA-dependent RNA polymerase
MLSRPPPQTDFWRTGHWQLNLPGERQARIRVLPHFEERDMRVPSPVDPDELYHAEFVCLL